MNDISKRYSITLNTKGNKTLSSDQLLFNHGDDVTIDISIIEDNVNKNLSQAKADLLLLHELDDNPVIHRFEDGGINISDNVVTILCKNSYINKLGVSVCQLIIRDENQSITTQMFSYKTSNTLISDEMINASEKIDTLVELDKTIENCKNKILETSNLLLDIDNKTNQLVSKVENEILSANSILREVERAEGERVITFDQIKKDNESLKSDVENTIANVQDGVTPNITIGNVTTLDPGVPATVVRRGNDDSPIFDFGIPKGIDGITPDMTKFENKINKQYEDINTKNNEFKDQMNTDFGNAKVGYDGREYLNVVDRLNGEFDGINQRFNDSTYLEYEGTNITADNSYYGLTKEMNIKGRTLQNLCPSGYTINWQHAGTWLSTFLYDNSVKVSNRTLVDIKPNTKYTIIINVTQNTSNMDVLLNNFDKPNSLIHKNLIIPKGTTGLLKYVVTTIEDFSILERRIFLRAQSCGATEGVTIVSNIIVLEGDYTNTPVSELPFGEGIYSVGESEDNLIKIKSCGKNLFKLRNISFYKSPGIAYTVDDNLTFTVNSDSTSGIYPSINTKLPAKLFKGKTVTLSCNLINYASSTPVAVQIRYIDETGFTRYVNFAPKPVLHTFTSEILSTVDFFICPNNSTNTGVVNSITVGDIMCEENTVKTEYEPYQEITQELQLAEPLRSLLNGVCDEILEDETEIRRVGKLEIDTSLFTKTSTYIEGVYRWKYTHPSVNGNIKGHILSVRCDKLPTISANDTWGHLGFKDGIAQNTNNSIMIYLEAYNDGSDLSKSSMIEKLGKITVYYELAEPIITKHNININLKTFEGTTHITSDNYLLPTLSCKVPSNVQATIMNLREENEVLNNTVSLMILENEEIKTVNETQDELIDVSLCATDEMFMLLKPLLSKTVNLSERSVSKMVDLYVAMVMRGLKTIEEVPARYREQVKEILAQLEK